jgi:hypothetical protein
MLVGIFRAGHYEGIRTSRVRKGALLGYGRSTLALDMPRTNEVVETKLIILPLRTLPISHVLAHREKNEPNTVFVGQLTDAEESRLRSAASATYWKRDADLRDAVASMKDLANWTVLWEELTPRQQVRIKGGSHTPHECWIWRPVKHLCRKLSSDRRTDPAPYRAFYVQTMGPVSKGVHLRHKCDNRKRMNPNHLIPGTPQDNVNDMMERSRHCFHSKKRAREIRRAARLKSHAARVATMSKHKLTDHVD